MANPISWLRDRLTPAERKPLSDKEEQSLIQKDQEKGVGSLFDSIPKLLEKEEEREEQEIMAFKKRLKHTQVLDDLFPINREISSYCFLCSIKSRHPTSRSPYESLTCSVVK